MAGSCFAALGFVVGVATYYDVGNQTAFAPDGPLRVRAQDALTGMGAALSFGFGLLAVLSFVNPSNWAWPPETSNRWTIRARPRFVAAVDWAILLFFFIGQFVGGVIGWGTGAIRLLIADSPPGAALAGLFGVVVAYAGSRLGTYRYVCIVCATFFSSILVPLCGLLLGAVVRHEFEITLLQDWEWLWIPSLVALVSVLGYQVGSRADGKMGRTEGPVTRVLMGLLVSLPAALAWLVVSWPK